MSKTKSKFVCQDCGSTSPKWLGKCPDCGAWNTYVEELDVKSEKPQSLNIGGDSKPQRIKDIIFDSEERYSTKIKELDIVLGGGIVKGSLILVGGDPGIGKSTLLLQVASNISAQGKIVLYVSGEESEIGRASCRERV